MTPPPAAAAAPVVQPRRPLAPRGPRRVSGPARRVAPARPARSRRAVGEAGFALGLFSALGSLAQHRLLDRLIRGRTWIGIVAFALIGIVTLQLGLLKLNGGIGRALEHEAVLQRQNAALSIENSELASGARVEVRAAHLGMAFAAAGAQHFLSSSSQGDVAKAATALSTAHSAIAASGESGVHSGKSGELQTGTEAQHSSEAAAAPASGAESSGSSESSGEAHAASSEHGEGSEAPSGETRAGTEATSPASSTAQGEAEPASGPAVEAGAGGGVQARSPGG